MRTTKCEQQNVNNKTRTTKTETTKMCSQITVVTNHLVCLVALPERLAVNVAEVANVSASPSFTLIALPFRFVFGAPPFAFGGGRSRTAGSDSESLSRSSPTNMSSAGPGLGTSRGMVVDSPGVGPGPGSVGAMEAGMGRARGMTASKSGAATAAMGAEIEGGPGATEVGLLTSDVNGGPLSANARSNSASQSRSSSTVAASPPDGVTELDVSGKSASLKNLNTDLAQGVPDRSCWRK